MLLFLNVIIWGSIGTYYLIAEIMRPGIKLIEGCDNVDDCLSKYKFEEAREYASGNQWLNSFKMEKIVMAETNYWIKQKDFDRAISIVDETAPSAFSPDDGVTKARIKFEILTQIIDKLIGENNFVEAEKWALIAPNNRNINGKGRQQNEYDPDENQRKSLLMKIKEAEKVLK